MQECVSWLPSRHYWNIRHKKYPWELLQAQRLVLLAHAWLTLHLSQTHRNKLHRNKLVTPRAAVRSRSGVSSSASLHWNNLPGSALAGGGGVVKWGRWLVRLSCGARSRKACRFSGVICVQRWVWARLFVCLGGGCVAPAEFVLGPVAHSGNAQHTEWGAWVCCECECSATWGDGDGERMVF